MRVDLYSLIHKAQRFHLFRLANDVGQSEGEDAVAMAALGSRTLGLVDHLRDHAHSEETYIHPLYHSIGFDLANLEREHHRLDETMDSLDEVVTGRQWDRLYREITALIAVYLPHIATEEHIQREVLWRAYGDPALAAVMQRFKTERAPAAARADLERVLPAMSVPEISRMFTGMKAAPAAVYDAACEVAAGILDPSRWDRVRATV